MVTRLVVSLESDERKALDELAKRELRDSRSQIRWILIDELIRRGFLKRTIEELDIQNHQLKSSRATDDFSSISQSNQT